MNREYIRGFFGIHPLPYHRTFHHWMAGASMRFKFLVVLWHLFWVCIGILIGRYII